MGEPVKLEFRVPGEAVPKGRARAFMFRMKGGKSVIRHHTPDKTVNYEDRVRLVAAEAIRAFHAEALRQGSVERVFPLEGAVRLTVTAVRLVPQRFGERQRAAALAGDYYPRTKPDASNLLKAVEDALNRIAYHDDGQIADARLIKRYGVEAETIVEVELLEDKVPEREVSLAVKLVRGKEEAKEFASREGHVLGRFKTLVESDDALSVSAACKACKRSVLVEVTRNLASPRVTGDLVGESCK